MRSVNANTGALTALQYLPHTVAVERDAEPHQLGFEGCFCPRRQLDLRYRPNQRGAVAGYTAVNDSLSRASSAVDVALSAGQSISDLLIQLKTKALTAADQALDTASRQAINQDFVALRDQIGTIVKNASFNGFNLVDGSTTQITALSSADGTRRITTAAQNMKLSGQIVTVKSTATIRRSQGVDMVATIQTSLTNGTLRWPSCRRASEVLDQASFAQKLSDTLTQGIGQLVDANMANESAMLSRSGEQQLGVQVIDRQSGASTIHPCFFQENPAAPKTAPPVLRVSKRRQNAPSAPALGKLRWVTERRPV